jgi:hypothetical protein
VVAGSYVGEGSGVEEGSVVQVVVQGGVVEEAVAGSLVEGPEDGNVATQPGALASEEPYSGPQNGLLSTDEISGEYTGCSLVGCGTTTIVPHGPDLIELWHEWCLWCPCGLDLLILGPLASCLFGIPKAFGPYMAGEVRRRRAGTNNFALEVHDGKTDDCCPDNNYAMAFTASGTVSGSLLSLRKRPNSEQVFQKVATQDIAGEWVSTCCCWIPACFYERYSTVDEDRFARACAVCCCIGACRVASALWSNLNGSASTATRRMVSAPASFTTTAQ